MGDWAQSRTQSACGVFTNQTQFDSRFETGCVGWRAETRCSVQAPQAMRRLYKESHPYFLLHNAVPIISCYRSKDIIILINITTTVVGVYRDWPGSQHQSCTFEICNFHFHYRSNIGIQVRCMQNVNCSFKIVGKYYMRCFICKKSISQIVHLLLLVETQYLWYL